MRFQWLKVLVHNGGYMKKLILLSFLLISTTCFADETTVHVNFTSEDGKFGDAIILTKLDFSEAEWSAFETVLATKGIEKKKQARIDAHKAYLASLTPKEPTKQELELTVTHIVERIDQLNSTKSEILEQIESAP